MRKYNKYKLIMLLIMLITSCGKEFLEVAPKGSLVASKTAEYENLLYSSLPIGSDAPTIALGDDVAMLNTYFEGAPLRLQRIFKWEPDFYEPEETATELRDPLSSIYIYNKIINEVMDSKEGNEEYKLRVLAEAKASKAYFYLLLVNYYSKPYDKNTAATDLSIPFINTADVSATSFARATVKEVYEEMVTNLLAAIPLIPVNQPNRLRMTRSAAELTLAKTYWFMADYENALKWITTAKTHLPTSFENGIYNYNQTYATGNWSVTSGYNNIESLLTRTSNTQWTVGSNLVLLAPWVYDLYTPGDKRLKAFSNVPFSATGTFPAKLYRRIGPFGSQVPQGIYLPDAELMLAECQARLNNLDAAKTTLQEFRKKRMPDSEANVNISNREQLIKFVIEERLREFALYGYRWFDMRRLSKDPLFSANTYKHVLYSEQTSQPLETYTIEEKRLTLRFPINVMNANPGIQNNP